MSIKFKRWPKIQQFHNTRKTINSVVNYNKTSGKPADYPIVTYRGKVKLDGTNAAIRVVNGEVAAQSRTRIITPEDDNFGFASYVENIKDWVTYCFGDKGSEFTIYGEWCGKSIQRNCAVSMCDRMFVIFAVDHIDGSTDKKTEYRDPRHICDLLHGDKPENLYTLPWYGENIVVDYSSEESVTSAVEEMCAAVAIVEECDPWVRDNFGHEGLGEGLVYYPVSTDLGCLPEDEQLMFKAKGAKHKNVIQLKPVMVSPEVVSTINTFVTKFVTENRLRQGITELNLTDISTKDTGSFLKWLGNDVRSESKDELEVAGLEWKSVAKHINRAARDWFFEEVSKC